MYSVAFDSSHQMPTAAMGMASDSANPWLLLQLPLSELLASGGDERLMVADGAVLNGYGCAPEPVSGIGEYSSSTASTVSSFGWAQAEQARIDLLAAEHDGSLDDAFDDRVENLRHRLRNALQLPDGIDIVFTSSGTDAALCASFLAGKVYGSHLTRIVPLAEETGSGVVSATQGLHFGVKSALGYTVPKNEPIWEGVESSTCVGVPGRNKSGEPLSEEDRDTAVVSAVSQAIHGGENVFLLAMDCSKTGLSMPSFKCLQEIASRWPGRVQIVIDACQMRLSRFRLRQYLNLNFPVMITGSKFFTGPAFCGALLIPPMTASFCRTIRPFSAGLRHYSGRFSWPAEWAVIRQALDRTPNFGEWLRWEATVAEMQRFFAVPQDLRSAALHLLARSALSLIDKTDGLRQVSGDRAEPCEGSDEEMSAQTIFAFLVCPDGEAFAFPRTRKLYEALNREISDVVDHAPVRGRAYHVGQPVALHTRDRDAVGALRVSLGARLIAQAWDPQDPQAFEDRIRCTIDGLAEALVHTAHLARASVN